MKYLIVGAGGTGGAIGGYLARAGKDVTLIARGAHLQAMRENGLKFETPQGDFAVPVSACTSEEYEGSPDAVFVCVKGYSLEGIVPFLSRVCRPDTVVIPILNIYGTGGRLQKLLPGAMVTDGCIYIAESVLSDAIERDALQKFSFVSPMAAAGAYYGVSAFALQARGQMRNTFLALVREIRDLADAMGISLPEDIGEINLRILDGLAPTATASMQRDLRDGKPSEMDGLIFEVVRLGKRYDVPTPVYEMIAEKFASCGDTERKG